MRILRWIKANTGLFIANAVVVSLALIPLYGILFPPLTDLPHHVIINKLLWEKLAGVSNLDLEVSYYLGYRLSTWIMVGLIAALKWLGLSLVYLPSMTAAVFMGLHAMVVVTVLYFGLSERSWRSLALAACFAFPAVVAMYSASWFIGFIGYTLAITLLVPAIFFTEKSIESGKRRDALAVFVCLALVYGSHPFALVFWLLWCFTRGLAAFVTRSISSEWKRFLSLGLCLLPVMIYHFVATSGTSLSVSNDIQVSSWPFVSPGYWLEFRLGDLLDGDFLRADADSASMVFALVVVGLIGASTVLAFALGRDKLTKNIALSSVLFLFISSWINEDLFPTPYNNWLAYAHRFSSTVYVVCLAVAAMTFIRSLSGANAQLRYKLLVTFFAGVSVLASAHHLFEVRKAYARFDPPARAYAAKLFARQRPSGITLPQSTWANQGQVFRRYTCLVEPDCNPEGTLFRNNGGDLYPVKMLSRRRIWPAEPTSPVANAFDTGEGYARGQFSRPRGIALDDDGNIYIADSGNSRVQKFDALGNYLFDFGTFGQGDGELRDPNGIAVDAAGNIYVVDASNQTLMRFAPDGRFQKQWKGPAPGFDVPTDIAIAPDGKLYILDRGRARVVTFEPAVDKFSSFGAPGTVEGQFDRPTGITVGGGLVFVADNGNDRVQVFDLDGRFVRQWRVPVWDHHLFYYPDVAFEEERGRLYVTCGRTREILVFAADGRYVNRIRPDPQAELKSLSSAVIAGSARGKHLIVVSSGSDAHENGDPAVVAFELTNANSE